MGCGCGGGRRNLGARPAAPQPQAGARSVQTQSNQRQVLIQQAKERLMQNGGQSASSEAERKRRIQVSLRRRNQGKS